MQTLGSFSIYRVYDIDLNSVFFSGTVVPMLEEVIDVVPTQKLAVHFHDTYGQALSNILASLQVTTLCILILA